MDIRSITLKAIVPFISAFLLLAGNSAQSEIVTLQTTGLLDQLAPEQISLTEPIPFSLTLSFDDGFPGIVFEDGVIGSSLPLTGQLQIGDQFSIFRSGGVTLRNDTQDVSVVNGASFEVADTITFGATLGSEITLDGKSLGGLSLTFVESTSTIFDSNSGLDSIAPAIGLFDFNEISLVVTEPNMMFPMFPNFTDVGFIGSVSQLEVSKVPIPATAILFLSSLAGLIGFRIKQR